MRDYAERKIRQWQRKGYTVEVSLVYRLVDTIESNNARHPEREPLSYDDFEDACWEHGYVLS